MTQIFIENNELDITEGLSNQITYAIDDLNNLDSKSTSFSKTIVLPGTARNNQLLGNIFEFANSNFSSDSTPNVFYNFNASRSAKTRIEIDGVQTMKGVLRLLQIIVDGQHIEYEVAIFGELGGFFTSLGAKKLTDLDFSLHNHTYNISNIVDSWDFANLGERFYYALIDYGACSVGTTKHNFYYRAFRPALFVREYIDKIITGAGYTWESDFFNTNFFKRLIVPNNQAKFSVNKNQVLTAQVQDSFNLSSVNDILLQNFIGTFSTGDDQTFTYTSGTNFDGVVNLNVNGFYSINPKPQPAGIGPAVPSGQVFGTFAIYKNGSLFYVDTTNRFGGNDAPSGITNQPYSLTFANIPLTLTTGDTFKIVALQFDATNGKYITGNVNGSIILTTQNPILSPAVLGDEVTMNATIPANILQKDFFASILKMFYLMVTEDKYTDRHLKIEPWVDFYDLNSTSYLDWSSKVDRSQPIKIKPMSEVTARYYSVKYKSDSDYFNDAYKKKYNEGYGDRIYDNMLEFAKDSDTTEVIFSATPLTGYAGEDKVFSGIMKKSNNVEEQVEHNIRILQAKKIEGVSSWGIYDSTTLLTTTTDYGYAGHLDDPDAPNADINFGVPKELYFELVSGALSNNLFNAYYSPYMAEITDKDSRLVTCKMYLNSTDIYNLDFGKFIWIDGVLYRISKIKDYTEGELTEVDLLRVIYNQY